MPRRGAPTQGVPRSAPSLHPHVSPSRRTRTRTAPSRTRRVSPPASMDLWSPPTKSGGGFDTHAVRASVVGGRLHPRNHARRRVRPRRIPLSSTPSRSTTVDVPAPPSRSAENRRRDERFRAWTRLVARAAICEHAHASTRKTAHACAAITAWPVPRRDDHAPMLYCNHTPPGCQTCPTSLNVR
jgi:hypothetical protein